MLLPLILMPVAIVAYESNTPDVNQHAATEHARERLLCRLRVAEQAARVHPAHARTLQTIEQLNHELDQLERV